LTGKTEKKKKKEEEEAAEAEQHRREVEEKEDAAASELLQRGRSMVGKPIRVQWTGGGSYDGRVTATSATW
jgi:hypothetical protein